MNLTIKQLVIGLIFFIVIVMYAVFGNYYFAQRDNTARVISSRIHNELSELSYLLSKHIKSSPISSARPLLDRKAANNIYLSAIAIFDNDQLVMTTDPGYSKVPTSADLYVVAHESNFSSLQTIMALKENVHYYEGKNLRNYTLIFYLDKKTIETEFTQVKRDFLLLLVVMPVFIVFVIWMVVGRLVAKPLEVLRQYAYYNSQVPSAFKVKEIEYIRASMVQTFNRLDQERKELFNQARTDSLSGLANRNYLQERVEQIIDLSERENKEFALLFLDLDHFKTVNDSLGHDIGDELLKSIAKTIHDILRVNDVVARIGGDEFVIVLTHYKNEIELYEIIERIQTQLMKPWLIKTFPIHITSSIGITVYPKDGKDLLSLMKNADIAMYEAKSRGRRGYHFFTESLNIKTQEYIELTNALRQALKNSEYELFYQPQNDVKNGQIIGAEALIRWNKPGSGFVPPNTFIPIAEKNGFIIELGAWVLETAIKQLREWQDQGFDLKMSINVAPQQIKHRDFVSQLESLLLEHKVVAKNVFLEITESIFLDGSNAIHQTFSAIKKLGVQISLDDFGTGYSSLSYLKKFPIDIIKIDKAFLDDYATEDGSVFIETILNMAKTLKLNVVAEGVETHSQVSYLQGLSCNYYQGYFCSPAVEIDAFNKLYCEHNK
ncbi:MAG: diguanylate cyclase (GGDEF)-like protein [Glaciecola sp.]|jgi:diguanylate cyclase (GGDEF)-like protein